MPGIFNTLGKFPRTFYVANVMEIFERMAWYGFFSLAGLYMTGSVASGGLGWSDVEPDQRHLPGLSVAAGKGRRFHPGRW
jgi:dipeptide/tripeptide permease